MTEADHLHHERVAICVAEGVPLDRAEEIASEQVEGRQKTMTYRTVNDD